MAAGDRHDQTPVQPSPARPGRTGSAQGRCARRRRSRDPFRHHLEEKRSSAGHDTGLGSASPDLVRVHASFVTTRWSPRHLVVRGLSGCTKEASMARRGQVLRTRPARSGSSSTRQLATRNGELLVFELLLGPDRRVPGGDVHPGQEERFEVVSGTRRFRKGLEDGGRVASPDPSTT